MQERPPVFARRCHVIPAYCMGRHGDLPLQHVPKTDAVILARQRRNGQAVPEGTQSVHLPARHDCCILK